MNPQDAEGLDEPPRLTLSAAALAALLSACSPTLDDLSRKNRSR